MPPSQKDLDGDAIQRDPSRKSLPQSLVYFLPSQYFDYLLVSSTWLEILRRLGLLPQLRAAAQINEYKTWSAHVSILMYTSYLFPSHFYYLESRDYTLLKGVCPWAKYFFVFPAPPMTPAMVRRTAGVGGGRPGASTCSRHIQRREGAGQPSKVVIWKVM